MFTTLYWFSHYGQPLISGWNSSSTTKDSMAVLNRAASNSAPCRPTNRDQCKSHWSIPMKLRRNEYCSAHCRVFTRAPAAAAPCTISQVRFLRRPGAVPIMSWILAIGPGRGVTRVLLPEHLAQDRPVGSGSSQTKSLGIPRRTGIALSIARLTNPRFGGNKSDGEAVFAPVSH